MNEDSRDRDALRADLDALTGRDPDGSPPGGAAAPADLDAMFAAVAAETVDRKRSVRDRLRELPTPMRIALAMLGALIMTGAALVVTRIRADITGQALLRYGLAMAAIAALVGVAFAVSMRGPHQRPVGRGVWAFIVVVLAIPLVLSVIPGLWECERAPAVHPIGGVHVPCLLLGIMTGALTAGVAWLFQRTDVPVFWRAGAAVGGGGLTAFAMLQLHCPARDATHLIVTHAGVGLMLALVVAGLVAWRRRTA